MELVPKAFVNVSLEHSYERDCLIIKDTTNKFEYQLTYLDIMEAGDFPFSKISDLSQPGALEIFLNWFHRNFLQIYAVPVTRPGHPPPWRSPF